MSGLAGLLDDVRGRMRRQVDRVAGVAYREGMLYVAGLARGDMGAAFEVVFLENVMLQAATDEWQQAVAEKTASLLARKGWSDVRVVYAMDESDVETIETSLPMTTSADETKRMAHFEAARLLHSEPASFFSALMQASDGGQAVSVLEKERAEALARAFDAAGIALWGISAPEASFHLLCEGRALSWDGCRLPIADGLLDSDDAFHGWDESFSYALYGAILMVKALPVKGRVFPLQRVELSGWAYGRAALAVAAVWLVALLVVSAADAYSWYVARREAEQSAAELALLYGDTQRMEDARAENAWMDAQEQALRQLTDERSPAAAVLVHLGTQNADGVCLDDITLQQGKPVELKGRAVTFDALSSYVQGFERDRAFFPDGPLLRDSTRPDGDEAGTVVFSMELRWGKEQGDADGGT